MHKVVFRLSIWIKLEVANVGLKGEKVTRDKPLGARARQQQNKLTYGVASGNRAQATWVGGESCYH